MKPQPKTKPTGRSTARRTARPPGSAAPVGDRELLEDYALQCCYERERSRWESVKAGRQIVYRAPASYNGKPPLLIDGEAVVEKAKRSEWRALRQWCAARRIPERGYVQLVFEGLGPSETRAPEPRQLTGQRYLEFWNQQHGRIAERLAQALDTQVAAARNAIVVAQSLGDDYDMACLKSCSRGDLPLSPLFRYCLAVSLGPNLAYVAKVNEADAILQFQRHPQEYTEAWASKLPPGFPALAAKKYHEVLLAVYGRG